MGSQTPSRASTTTWCQTVAEIGREDFPELGVRHDEIDRTGGMVGAPFQFRMDPHQVHPVSLQSEARCGSSAYTPAAQRLPVQILDRQQWGASCSPRTHQTWLLLGLLVMLTFHALVGFSADVVADR